MTITLYDDNYYLWNNEKLIRVNSQVGSFYTSESLNHLIKNYSSTTTYESYNKTDYEEDEYMIIHDIESKNLNIPYITQNYPELFL